MAKGQKRSNKELKKPKQNKPKPAAANAGAVGSVFNAPAPDRKGKSPKR